MAENDSYRLVLHQKTRIDTIRESIPKPSGYLPKNSLPIWEALSMEQKLPLVPAPPGSLFYSRGKLGEPLLRTRIGEFTTIDRYNQERIPSNTYETLHDKYNGFQNNTEVQKALKKHELINEDADVICSLKEFNRFRKYLASHHNDQVRDRLREMDELATVETAMNREIQKEEQYSELRAIKKERAENAKKYVASQLRDHRKSFMDRQGRIDYQLAFFRDQKEQQRAAKVLSGLQKNDLCRQRLIEKEERAKRKSDKVLQQLTVKERNSVFNRDNLENEKKREFEKKRAEWFEAKRESAQERFAREKELQDEYVSELKERSERRQQRVEKFRDELPLRIAKRKAEEKRIWDIVRKYAMRWLSRVRERLRKRITDDMHGSFWHISHAKGLQDMVKFLYQQSGYEKLDDVVMNILKFKEALKKQMLLEEAEEEEEDEEED